LTVQPGNHPTHNRVRTLVSAALVGDV